MGERYQRYPEYRDSGVEWLGEVPEHWASTRLKFLSNINMGQSPSSEDCNQEGVGLPFLQGNAEFGGVYPTPKNYCEVPRKIAEKGDLLFSVRAPVGALNIADQKYGIGRGLCSLRVKGTLLKKFLWWLIPIVRTELDSVSTGSTFEAVSSEQVQNVFFICPAIEEQLQIAAFLDHETAKIDTLIEKQQTLIALLKEKRQAVISHAVTKGLNPDVPMRDSGIEWLGEVPEGWVVSRVKNVVNAIVDGPHFSPKYQDHGYMFISARNIKTDHWALDDAKFISEKDFFEFNKRVQPVKGDVLLTKGGTTGVARAVDLDFAFQVWVHVAVLKVIQVKVNSFFIAFALNGQACYEQSKLYTRGATNNDLGLSRIANIYLAVPPKREQDEIVFWLDERCRKFDILLSKVAKNVELLKERRTAVISAAVTGKIDVRNWQAPVQNQPNSVDAA